MNDKTPELEAPEAEALENAGTQLSLLNWKNRHKADDKADEVPLWLITFTDIMALMLTFFVLLYSMSIPEVKTWEELISSINRGFSKYYSASQNFGPQDTISIDKINFREALSIEYLENLIDAQIRESESLENVVTIAAQDRLIISLPQNLLFDAGQDEVKTEGKRALFVLGEMLSRIKNRIEIVGNSDPRPVGPNNQTFDSNWELSLSRATQVSNVLTQVGYRRNMIVRGMSSARYDELPETIPENRRLDLSRRVDIVVLKDDGSKQSTLRFIP